MTYNTLFNLVKNGTVKFTYKLEVKESGEYTAKDRYQIEKQDNIIDCTFLEYVSELTAMIENLIDLFQIEDYTGLFDCEY